MTQDVHLDYLDGWRGLAICCLLVGHFFPIPGIDAGLLGVSLFFVLSGYLMAGLLFIKNTPLAVFYRRRISRIIPVHVVFISMVCGAFFMFDRAVNWSEVPRALFFVQNYFAGKSYSHTLPFGHIWSLAVEEHAYIVLSVVALLARRKWATDIKVIGLLALGCIGFGIWYAVHYVGPGLEWERWMRTEVSAYGILASAFLAVYFSRQKIPQLGALTYLAIIGTAVVTQWWSVPLPIREFAGVGLLALAVNLLSAAPTFIKAVLSWKPLRMMGIWSFSLYIWQQPFIAHFTVKDWVSQAAMLGIAIAVGIISFYAIEQPARHWLNHNWGANAKPSLQPMGQEG